MTGEFTLNSPLTKEDWDKITDVELEHTKKIWFATPSGKKVEYVPISSVDDIKADFISQYPKNVYGDLELGGRSCVFSLNKVLEIIDKHIGGER